MDNINLLTENGVNVNKGIELLGSIETYNEMLEDFLVEVEEKIENLEEYFLKQDLENYSVLVHSLKSDAKYFGFDVLAEMSLSHEMKSKGSDMEYVKSNFDILKKEVSRLIDLINKYIELNKAS